MDYETSTGARSIRWLVPELQHSDIGERWFLVGFAANGALFDVAYLWFENDRATTTFRLISAFRVLGADFGKSLGLVVAHGHQARPQRLVGLDRLAVIIGDHARP